MEVYLFKCGLKNVRTQQKMMLADFFIWKNDFIFKLQGCQLWIKNKSILVRPPILPKHDGKPYSPFCFILPEDIAEFREKAQASVTRNFPIEKWHYKNWSALNADETEAEFILKIQTVNNVKKKPEKVKEDPKEVVKSKVIKNQAAAMISQLNTKNILKNKATKASK